MIFLPKIINIEKNVLILGYLMISDNSIKILTQKIDIIRKIVSK